MTTSRTTLLCSSYIETPLGWIDGAGVIENHTGVAPGPMRDWGRYAAVLVLRGAPRYRDENGVDRVLGPGDLMLLFPKVRHHYAAPHGQTYDELYASFDGPLFRLWRKAKVLDPASPVVRLSPAEHWASRFRAAVEPLRDPAHVQNIHDVCRLAEVLADALVAARLSAEFPGDKAFLRHAATLLSDPHGALPLEAVADRLGLPYHTFRQRFTRLAGTPPARFRTRQTIARASRLLRNPAASVKQVALECGYANPFHFSRHFKQVTGVSLQAYRRRLYGQPAGE